MGLSNKTQRTTQNSTSSSTSSGSTSSTVQRNNPAWVEDAIKGITAKAGDLMNRDPLDFVAGANPLQTQAAGAAAGLGGWRGALDAAGEMATRAGSARTPEVGSGYFDVEGMGKFMSPYLRDVVDTTAADFDVDAGRTRAAQAASGARSGAFGGSRFGVREAETEGELSRARASTLANLRDQGFSRAADLANRDADRRMSADIANQSARAADYDRELSAGGLMGTLSNLGATNARSDIDAQMGAGDAMRGIETEQRQTPLGILGAVKDIVAGSPLDLFSGQTSTGTTDITSNSTGTATGKTTQSGSIIDQIGQAVQIAAAIGMSDLRLKRDVETIGFDDAGRRWVSWRWNWDDDDAEPTRGLIAQETLKTDPAAVIRGKDGLLRIDYSQVEVPPWLHS